MINWKKISAIVLASTCLAGTLVGCGSEDKSIDLTSTAPSIEIMTSSTKTTSAGASSPVVQAIEDHLGKKMSEKYGTQYDKVKLNMNWVLSTAYGEKVTAALGAGQYPNVMLVTARNSSIIQNSKHGTFNDIKFAFDDPERYPYFAQANKSILKNITIDGKIDGVYRARTIGRNGMTFRKDWVLNLYKKGVLNFEEPKTIADLDAMVKAFTENDPDGDGQKNTYGMIITTYLAGPWGYDEETDTWKPSFMSQGYFDALTKLRDWYAAGYINKDMATLDPNSWDTQFLNGYGGIQIDVADRARRNATNIESKDPNAIVDVIGYVTKDEGTNPAILPTTGYNGYYVMPKKTVQTEEELDFILSVLDECNSPTVVNLCNYGIEGMHYTLDENGKAVVIDDDKLTKDYADLNQFSMAMVSGSEYLSKAFANIVAAKVQEVYESNEQWGVANPMAPYISENYAMSGTQLDAIIDEAKTNYITGNLDADGYRKAVEQWMKMDGDLVCEDFKRAFDTDETNIVDGKIVIPEEYKYQFAF